MTSRMAVEEHARANEELRKTNEELQRSLQQHDRRSTWEWTSNLPVKDTPKPFSQAIMNEAVSSHYITPKMAFFMEVEDPESHLTAFNVQMIILWGTDAIRCKMFMGTFTGTTLQWFSGIPDSHITSFSQFARLFREQFSTNKVKPPRLYDSLTWGKGGRKVEGVSEQVQRTNSKTPDARWRDDDRRFLAGDGSMTIQWFVDQEPSGDVFWGAWAGCRTYWGGKSWAT